MNKISSPNKFDEKSNGDIRRDLRRSFEKKITEKEPDRIQLNDIMLAVIVLIAAIISFADFTLSFGSIKNFTALTVFLYIITSLVYRNRYARGMQKGKGDVEYIGSLEEYRKKRQSIYDSGLAGLVPQFCKDYRARELREYRESLLIDIDMDYDEYKEKFLGRSKRYIVRSNYSAYVKRVLLKCNTAKPIRLVSGLILNESGEMDREKLIGQSGQEREALEKRVQLVQRGLMVLFGSVVAINIILDFSLLTIFQWLVRMMPIVVAIITGEDSGFCNVTVTETNFKRDQSRVINLFFEYTKEIEAAKKAEEEEENRKNAGL